MGKGYLLLRGPTFAGIWLGAVLPIVLMTRITEIEHHTPIIELIGIGIVLIGTAIGSLLGIVVSDCLEARRESDSPEFNPRYLPKLVFVSGSAVGFLGFPILFQKLVDPAYSLNPPDGVELAFFISLLPGGILGGYIGQYAFTVIDTLVPGAKARLESRHKEHQREARHQAELECARVAAANSRTWHTDEESWWASWASQIEGADGPGQEDMSEHEQKPNRFEP